MNAETKVTLIKKLDVTDMAGDKVMMDFDSGKYFMLRGSAADIWDLIAETTVTVGQVVQSLMEQYDVDKKTCEESVVTFLKSLEANGFIRVEA